MQDFGSGPGGPMISGKWFNRQTGKIVNVRDSIINGDEMIVITDAGQIPMDDFSRNYIQASNDIYDESGKVIGKEDINVDEFLAQNTPEPVSFNNNTDNSILFSKPFANQEKQQTNTTNKQENEKEKLIKTIFDKTPSPKLTVNIDWTEFPKNELNMLINYFEVSKEDIAAYISKSIDSEQVMSSIIEFLESKLQ